MKKNQRLVAAVLLASACSTAYSADSNLLPNGDFSNASQLSGWLNAGPGTFLFSQSDANNNPDSGSMLLIAGGNFASEYAVSSCFGVSPGAAYSYGGQGGEFSTTVDAGTTQVVFSCTVYSSSTCAGSGSSLPPLLIDYNAGPFSTLQSTSGTLPAALSANCVVSFSYTSTLFSQLSIVGGVDNLFFNSAAPTAPPITLDGYMSGNWYDTAQTGQGFELELTDEANAMLAIWFTYTPDGSGPTWIYAQGPYDATSNTVTLPAEILTGAKFPPLFNSADLDATPWGTMTFTFADCNHGTASWNSSVAGYGSGSMPISRLTRIRGTSCPQ